jgi:hypothetical protein
MHIKPVAITAVVLLGWAATIFAAQPTVSDIAICNQEAEAQALTPSASPGPRAGDKARDSIPVTSEPGGQQLAATPKTGEKTDPSGSVIIGTTEPLLEGMAANRADDPAYRMAYYDCMKRQTGQSG